MKTSTEWAETLTQAKEQLKYDKLFFAAHWPPVWPPVSVRDPSFRRELRRQRRADRTIMANSKRGQFITAIDVKLQAYRLVEYIAKDAHLKLSPPTVFAADRDIAALDPSTLGQYSVVKPAMGRNNRGVFCLERQGDKFFDVPRKQSFTWDEVRQTYLLELEQAPADKKYSRNVFAEEWVRDDVRGHIPLDYRFYCFFGRCVLIQQRDCNQGMGPKSRLSRYYNRAWQDVGNVCVGKQTDATLSPPERGEEAVRLAEAVSSYVPLAFMRVDFYVTPEGVRFGEFTPYPGSRASFIPPVDAVMGRYYRDAERRLRGSRFPERDVLLAILRGEKPQPSKRRQRRSRRNERKSTARGEKR